MYIYPHTHTYTYTYIHISAHIVRDDCERMMDKSFELHCAATEAVSAGRDSLTLESQVFFSQEKTSVCLSVCPLCCYSGRVSGP